MRFPTLLLTVALLQSTGCFWENPGSNTGGSKDTGDSQQDEDATGDDAAGDDAAGDDAAGDDAADEGAADEGAADEGAADEGAAGSNLGESQEASGPWDTRNLEYFRENPSDRFVVDTANIQAGHPFLGSRIPSSIGNPHKGAHLTYDVASWPRGGTAPENYPAVYAVADAKILNVSTWFGMGPGNPNCRDLNEHRGEYGTCDNHPDERCGDIRHLTCPAGSTDPTECTSSVACSVEYGHYKYDIMTQIGTQDGERITFSYSIEPFFTPRDPVTNELLPRFYEPFIKVSAGQTVNKGDILAYHYLVPGYTGAHIHYQINRAYGGNPSAFTSPSIFSQGIIDALKPTWTGPGFNGAGIPLCMGVYLGASETPFASQDPEGDGINCQ
jgi:hypothetical protein